MVDWSSVIMKFHILLITVIFIQSALELLASSVKTGKQISFLLILAIFSQKKIHQNPYEWANASGSLEMFMNNI